MGKAREVQRARARIERKQDTKERKRRNLGDLDRHGKRRLSRFPRKYRHGSAKPPGEGRVPKSFEIRFREPMQRQEPEPAGWGKGGAAAVQQRCSEWWQLVAARCGGEEGWWLDQRGRGWWETIGCPSSDRVPT